MSVRGLEYGHQNMKMLNMLLLMFTSKSLRPCVSSYAAVELHRLDYHQILQRNRVKRTLPCTSFARGIAATCREPGLCGQEAVFGTPFFLSAGGYESYRGVRHPRIQIFQW